MFDHALTDEERDTKVVLYLAVRARLPWLVLAAHDLWHVFGPRYSTPQHAREVDVWRYHLNRLGLDDAHRRPSCRLVRP